MLRYLIAIAAVMLSMNVFSYEGKERVIWSKKPIDVTLKVGEERIIHFPNDIEHWQPDAVKSVVIAQTVADTFYIRATGEFPVARFRIRERASNKVYLIDVNATKDAKVPDETVIIDEEQIRGESDKQAETMARLEEDWRVRLTRYAAQNLYSPSRVVKASHSISRVPLDSGIEVPIVRGGKVKAETVASWRGGGWYVHAVKLTNISNENVNLDPRIHFRGNWSTATAQHAWVGPVDTDESVTTVYFTSKRSFHESVGVQE